MRKGMQAISFRLPIPLKEKVEEYCRATGTTRIELLASAIDKFRCTRDAGHEIHRSGHQFNLLWPPNPREFFEQLAPASQKRVRGLKRELIATHISENNDESLEFLAKDTQLTRRQIIEAALLLELSSEGYRVPSENSFKLSKFWERIGPCSEEDAVLCLLEQGAGDWKETEPIDRFKSWTGERLYGLTPAQLEKRYRLPEGLNGETVLIDASMILVCLSQNEKAQRYMKLVLEGPLSTVITSATVSEVAVKGSALFSATEDISVEKRLLSANEGHVEWCTAAYWSTRLSELIESIPSIPIEPRDCAYALKLAERGRTSYSRLVSLAAIYRRRKVKRVMVLRAIKNSASRWDSPVKLCIKEYVHLDSHFLS